jgi:hypothetical protein
MKSNTKSAQPVETGTPENKSNKQASSTTEQAALFKEMEEFHSKSDDAYQIDKSDFESVESFETMPEGIEMMLLADYMPDVTIVREKDTVTAEIQDHIYTKYWESKWHGLTFAKAMLRAIKKLRTEGHLFSNGTIENEDPPHIFINWDVRYPATVSGKRLFKEIDKDFELVYSRANLILEMGKAPKTNKKRRKA